MENWYQRGEVVGVTKPDHVVLRLLKLACGRNLEEFVEG
jgi:hypothetical protein